jgi:hypothetical protein
MQSLVRVFQPGDKGRANPICSCGSGVRKIPRGFQEYVFSSQWLAIQSIPLSLTVALAAIGREYIYSR